MWDGFGIWGFGFISICWFCFLPNEILKTFLSSFVYVLFFSGILELFLPGSGLKILHTGCPKKNAILCLMGHREHQEWTRDKSRLSFENLRKFPFWWAQKLPIFDRKWLRKMRSKMPTPMVKWHDFLSHWKCSIISMKRLVDNPFLAIKFLLN